MVKDNLKTLVEKRNAEKSAAEKIYNGAHEAKRGLKDAESVGMVKHYRSAKKFNDAIKALKAKRNADKETKKIKTEKVNRGAKHMKKDVKKSVHRALDTYLRTGSKRDLNSLSYSEKGDGNADKTIPNTIDNTIIPKLTEDAPVFNAVRRINSVNGTLSLLQESDTDESGFVGEAEDLKQVSSKMNKITLHQKRVGAFVELTEDIMQDSAVNLVNYALGRLSWGFGKTIERAILTGAGQGSFQPIIGNINPKHETSLPADFSTDDLLDVTYTINPQYLRNAMFVVSRPVFNMMGHLKDGNGQLLVLKGTVNDNDASRYSFRGIPVLVSDVLNNADTQLILGDFNAGYGLMVKQGMNIQHITADTRQALAGGHLIVLSAYMDGAVINPDAFVTAKVAKK